MKHTIKCSQCDKTFSGGYDYRIHWEKAHLDNAIKQNEIRRTKETNN